MTQAYLYKTPQERLDYDIQFYRELRDGDHIIAASATSPSSSVVIEEVQFSDHMVKLWISGGTPHEQTPIHVHVETILGRKFEVCFQLRIKECCHDG